MSWREAFHRSSFKVLWLVSAPALSSLANYARAVYLRVAGANNSIVRDARVFSGKPLEQKEADHGTLFDGSPGACCGGDR